MLIHCCLLFFVYSAEVVTCEDIELQPLTQNSRPFTTDEQKNAPTETKQVGKETFISTVCCYCHRFPYLYFLFQFDPDRFRARVTPVTIQRNQFVSNEQYQHVGNVYNFVSSI